ncbi:beta-carotene 15,15'-monooxygenase [Chryseobacterium sp. SC28]|uniref:beta-carotene 15,15'-monooxygenase n=1 Tax=Chryseobacterium sp. SC28 TaxID=2268028 RepID=UPI000F645AB1|nr:beta-carotene 15,15'-monooxygenase [Chryseobacterium sp. SC28]RRQ45623.1 beta-carotene 15,15'-monooxygenase [Chryseobacterium sp. SC28]
MPNSKDFDIDSLKKAWQEQEIASAYEQNEIESMLNKKSRNYVKYILWISIAEFVIFGLINFSALFFTDSQTDFTGILNRLQIKNQNEIELSLDRIYDWMKVFSLVISGIFVAIFYRNYKKINVESDLKKFITHIIQFKKTVNLFIFSSVVLLILFIVSFTSFLIFTVRQQNIDVDNPTIWALLMAMALSLTICIILILLYYKLAYGILLKRLSRNLSQLEEIESEKVEQYYN